MKSEPPYIRASVTCLMVVVLEEEARKTIEAREARQAREARLAEQQRGKRSNKMCPSASSPPVTDKCPNNSSVNRTSRASKLEGLGG
jgi:hypothetical protein